MDSLSLFKFLLKIFIFLLLFIPEIKNKLNFYPQTILLL